MQRNSIQLGGQDKALAKLPEPLENALIWLKLSLNQLIFEGLQGPNASTSTYHKMPKKSIVSGSIDPVDK